MSFIKMTEYTRGEETLGKILFEEGFGGVEGVTFYRGPGSEVYRVLEHYPETDFVARVLWLEHGDLTGCEGYLKVLEYLKDKEAIPVEE